MKKIEGSPKSLKQLLQNTKYTIHYYQREYMWQRKHIEELVDDLTTEFLEYYKPEHTRQEVENYGAYFMGSIVLAGHGNAIIDGQQRFSSLTLLLIYLNNKLKEIGQSYNMIDSMIFSESFGSKSFNINVEDRYDCMDAIYNNKPFDPTNFGESIKNLYARYNDIEEVFPLDEIHDEALLHFCDWLAERVFFIEIVASTEQDAHKIFVTMNDRGLSLTSTEMLKGYILSKISDDKTREKLNGVWKDKVQELKKEDEKGDEIFIKNWLRAQYAETIRENKAGAVKEDFDIIGGPFHKWVQDEHEKLNLGKPSEDYENFIKYFAKYADVYLKIREAESVFSEETKYIFYNAQINFTLQTQILLAPICYEDSEQTIVEKLNLVARFIDLWIHARVTNYHSVDYSTIKSAIFGYTKSIRRLSLPDLKAQLKVFYDEIPYKAVDAIPEFGLNTFSKKYIKNMLARITAYIEEQSGVASNYQNYVNTDTRNPFEIEHIITDHFEWFREEYATPEEFKIWRNKIGGLLLLHKSINASLNDKLYADKLPTYCSNEGNIYTESLGEKAYQNNPRFKRFVADHNLNFKAFAKFGKEEINERNKLFAQLVSLVWNDEMFSVVA